MTLEELQAETLSQKNRRIVQARCAHEEIYSSSVYVVATGKTNTTSFCLDCFKTDPVRPVLHECTCSATSTRTEADHRNNTAPERAKL